jgi:hypothetical protein
MAIGNIPNEAQLNSQIAQLATQWRTLSQQTLAFQAYVVGLGTTGLQSLGFAPGDSTQFVTMADYMATMAQVFQGSASQPAAFNFQNALVAVTGPY